MPRRHKECVKAYLLGFLDEIEAAQIEAKYFADSAYFQWVQDVETELIGDYLAGRLKPEDRGRFESRYLTVPEMRKRLEEVRSATPLAARQVFRIRWYAAVNLRALGVAVLGRARHRNVAHPASCTAASTADTGGQPVAGGKQGRLGRRGVRATSQRPDTALSGASRAEIAGRLPG